MTRRAPPTIATLENAYRVATKIADTEDRDTAVARTGEPARPYVVTQAQDPPGEVVVRITASQFEEKDHGRSR